MKLLHMSRKYATYAWFALLALAAIYAATGQDVPVWLLALLGGGAAGSLLNTDKDKPRTTKR